DSIFMLVRFTGLDIGSQVGAIRLFTNECTTDPNNPPCVLKTVRGNVVPPPTCTIMPTSLTLTPFASCLPAQETVTITNTGGLPLIITRADITGSPDIVLLNPATNAPVVFPVTVQPGESVRFLVRCSPIDVGTSVTTIRFISNDPNVQACQLRVTCVALRGPICEVVMPDTVNGAPDGRTFGRVAIVPMTDPRFGMNVGGIQFGEKRLPIEVRNIGDAPLVLTPPPGAPFTTNPFVTNTNFIVEGFTVGQTIPPGGKATGTVIFRPTLRQLQKGAIRFFTNTCQGQCVISEVNGIGIANALCEIPTSLSVGTAPVGSSVTATFLMVNRGDLPLVISDPLQIVTDNPRFAVVTPLPITVPPEFEGGAAGVPIRVRFTPTAPGQQIGRIQFNFNATVIGPVAPCVLNVSGNGTAAGSGQGSGSGSVIPPGDRRP
ncbi:MAG: choice-of-anchor D domain-containing protein, partial [Blastocatellia bacterium]|nr:choice-of-anchor D domain-containing protein [Blastocatellia bacterium]